MKKIFIILLGSFLFTTATFAQQKPTTVKTDSTKTVKKLQPVNPNGTRLKADGTPDKRFKENKDLAPVEAMPHLKKDGTMDKRFKATKDTTEAKKKKQ